MDKERENFKSELAVQLANYETILKQYEGQEPPEERPADIIEAENALFQMVMDSVNEVDYFLSKLSRIAEFTDVLSRHYGKNDIKILQMATILQERLLLALWGVDNPHDPFGKLDKDS